ncbi:hypothetical protein [Halocola ammonii]
MKNFQFYFNFALLLGVLSALAGCEKDDENKEDTEDLYETYFVGKVNGENFETYGYWSCSSIYGTYYPDGYLDFESGFMTFTAKNCNTSQSVIIGKVSNLEEGVFTSTDTSDIERPWCTFADLDYDFETPEGESINLSANHRKQIRLEITRFEQLEDFGNYYVEGKLDAIVQDTVIDSTIVLSDVKFGYEF